MQARRKRRRRLRLVTESAAVIEERIARFVASCMGSAAAPAESFEELALAAFAFQFEHIPPYRRLCAGRGASPDAVHDWRRIPPLPVSAFKTLDVSAGPARETFRSSGTTQGQVRSVHRHPFPDLYRAVIDASFPVFCLSAGTGPRLPVLSLIPSREQLPDSSLSFMADHVLTRWGSPESATLIGARGVEAARARSWAGSRQREGRPVLVLATALALVQWLDWLDRVDLRFRLPAGSIVFETGGFKGRTAEVIREELLGRLFDRLGVGPEQVVREYGMTELTSQCYTRALQGGDPDLFVAPPWTRVRIFDPETLEEAPPGRTGLISVVDLANVGSAIHLLTEDLGRAEGDGFRLLGRAAGAELRGCSQVVEELRDRRLEIGD
jgi:acyl-protein synthetase LuxE